MSIFDKLRSIDVSVDAIKKMPAFILSIVGLIGIFSIGFFVDSDNFFLALGVAMLGFGAWVIGFFAGVKIIFMKIEEAEKKE